MVRIVKDPKERKKEIIFAASQLFLTKGYDKTTMKDVMITLDIAKGTIYHYFKSKDDLLEEVIESIVKQKMLSQRELLEKTEGTALERIRQLILAGSESGQDQEKLLDHLHKPANAGMHIRMVALLVTMQAPLYEELIRQGCQEGVFTTQSPLECAEFILSAIQFLTDDGVYPWTIEQLTRRFIAFPDIIESLLQAPKGSFQFLLELLH